MKWAKKLALLVVVITLFVIQTPVNVFGATATEYQRSSLEISICSENDVGDLRRDLGMTGLFDWHGSNEQKYCIEYFKYYLGDTSANISEARRVLNNENHAVRIVEHVKWWLNAANQSTREIKDSKSFMVAYCSNSSERKDSPDGGWDQVYTFDCTYDNGLSMINPYCSASYYRDGNSVSADPLVCRASESQRDKDTDDMRAGNIGDEDDEGVSGNSSGDECNKNCGDGSPLSYIFCPLGCLISEAINFLIKDFLLPMLQWRIVIS